MASRGSRVIQGRLPRTLHDIHNDRRYDLATMADFDVDIDDFTVQNILEPLLNYLSSVLPPPIFTIVRPLVTYSLALLSAFFHFVSALSSSQSWDAQKILPPLITLLMAYLALVSFYRTTGWMLRTAFWFVKWGGILAALAAGAGYLLGTQGNADAVGGLGGGVLSMLGSALLGMLNEDTAQGRNTRRRAGAGAAAPKPRSQPRKQKEQKERPKAWESWDKHREHRDWQYSAEAEYRDEAARMNEGVQEAVQKVAGFVQGALGSGWWETVKKTVEGSGLVGTDDAKDRESRSKRGAKEEVKGRAGT